MKILTASPFETLFHPPKFTKNHNNQKIQLWQTSIFAREVSQKSFLTFPCCMGLVFLFDCHAAWERDFSLLRHLPRENVIFFIFSTRPQRKAQKHRKPHHGVMLWTCRRERCKMQIATKIHPCPEGYDRDAFFT